MKRVVAVGCALVLLGGFAFAEGSGEDGAPGSEAEVLEELLALERAALDDWYGKSDPGLYAEQFGDTATYFDPWSGGILWDESIREYLAGFAGQIPKLEYTIHDERVDILGNVAILTFCLDALEVSSGAETEWNVSLVYNKNGTAWEKVHANWSYTAAVPST
jgi:hypothetical protein